MRKLQVQERAAISSCNYNRCPAVDNKSNSDSLLSRIGALPYLNNKPLIYGIEKKIVVASPSDLARMLRRSDLDAALVSIVEVLLTGKYYVLDRWGIVSDGRVRSVILFHRKPLEQIDTVYCDRASLTSVILLRILLHEHGLHPRFRPLPEQGDLQRCDAVLLIGDQALRLIYSGTTYQLFDLGQAWKEYTGLPFVYAVWAIRPGPNAYTIARILDRAASAGTRAIEQIAAEADGFDYAFRLSYLTESIHYELTEAAKCGIKRFVELLNKYRAVPVYEPQYLGLSD